MTREKRHIHFTFEGKPVLSFHIDETSDGGLIFSPDLTKQDIHLTVWEKDGKIRSHIHHGGAEESNDIPLGRTTSTKVVSRNLQKMFKKRLEQYHGNKACYVFTPERWERIKTFLPIVDELGNIIIPIESFAGFLDMDFSKRELWGKAKIRSLLSAEPYFGFMETRSGLRRVMPISEKLMFVWPLMKVNELGDYVMEVLGFDDLFNYLEDVGVSKKMRADMREKIRKLEGNGSAPE